MWSCRVPVLCHQCSDCSFHVVDASILRCLVVSNAAAPVHWLSQMQQPLSIGCLNSCSHYLTGCLKHGSICVIDCLNHSSPVSLVVLSTGATLSLIASSVVWERLIQALQPLSHSAVCRFVRPETNLLDFTWRDWYCRARAGHP